MSCTIVDAMFVPYGIDRWDMTALPAGGLAAAWRGSGAPFPLMVVENPEEGLRLNSVPLRFPAVADLGSFDALRLHLTGLFSPWDGTSRRVMHAYFDWVGGLVERRREALEAKLAPYKGLYGYADFRFSAPMPLPRAHLSTPETNEQKDGSDDFVRVDIAFFPGGSRIVALVSDDEAPRARRARRDRLLSMGVEVFSLEAFAADGGAFTQVLCPDDPDRFWAGVTVPCGPLQPYIA